MGTENLLQIMDKQQKNREKQQRRRAKRADMGLLEVKVWVTQERIDDIRKLYPDKSREDAISEFIENQYQSQKSGEDTSSKFEEVLGEFMEKSKNTRDWTYFNRFVQALKEKFLC